MSRILPLLINRSDPKNKKVSSLSQQQTAQNRETTMSVGNGNAAATESKAIAQTHNNEQNDFFAAKNPPSNNGMPQRPNGENSPKKSPVVNSAEAKEKSRRKRTILLKPGQTAGRWTPEEHQAFLEGLKIYGREWKKVADQIPTRTSAQIRSHAQKYFAKIERDEQLMMQDHAPMPHPQPFVRHPIVAPTNHSNRVPSSVQRHVDRILANPGSVESEVEDTLRRLRERYHQLQVSLEEQTRHQRPGHQPNPRRRGRVVENDQHESETESRNLQGSEASTGGRNSSIDGASDGAQRNFDDLSSVSSAVSALSRDRGDLGNEELIALSVLGGSLPRSNSGQDLRQQPAQQQADQGDTTETDASSDNGSSCKKRKLADDKTTDHDGNGSSPRNDGMVH